MLFRIILNLRFVEILGNFSRKCSSKQHAIFYKKLFQNFFFKNLLTFTSNSSGQLLESCRTSMMETLGENSKQLKAAIFTKKLSYH